LSIRRTSPAFLSHVFSPQTFSVAAVTFANGGDNIRIYTPLFASLTAWTLLLMIAVFLILIAVWCCAGYALSRQPHVAAALARYGDGLVPIVLIAIGVFVLHENDSLSLLSGS
jgi:cadmium resistance protein CadD (predicted permease)